MTEVLHLSSKICRVSAASASFCCRRKGLELNRGRVVGLESHWTRFAWTATCSGGWMDLNSGVLVS